MTTTKTGARKAAPPKAAQRKQVDPSDWTKLPLQEQIRRLAWLYAELVYATKVGFAQMALANPQIQQQLAERLVQQGGRI